MPTSSERPLRKVTMNFYADDIDYFESAYGPGWSQEIRNRISDFVRLRKRVQLAQVDTAFQTNALLIDILKEQDDGK